MAKALWKQCTLILVFSVAVIFISMTAKAAPYSGDIFELKQPDNSHVKVKVFGDEFYQRVESLDGYTLIRDSKTGWICYAEQNVDQSDFISTGRVYLGVHDTETDIKVKSKLKKGIKLKQNSIYQKADVVKKALYPSTALSGNNATLFSPEYSSDINFAANNKNIIGLTLLINFPDKDTSISKQEISDMLNKEGYNNYGNNGSVRDYYYDISGGLVTYSNYVADFYTAKNPKSYYDDSNYEVGVRSSELITEALQNLQSKGYDFSALTTNSSGVVLALNVFYAGSADMGWGKGLWPHSGYLKNYFNASGVKITHYQICPLNSSLAIGTSVHENGHMLFGWPDLYDYEGDSKGAGAYSLMSLSSGGNPVPPDPFLRNLRSGWGRVIKLNDYPDNSTITVNSNSLDVYKYEGSNSSEYYLIESIKKSGRWTNMPDEGLLIWHIDEKGSNDRQEMLVDKHYIVSVVQADGQFELEKNINSGGPNDLYHSSGYDIFNDSTVPNSRWWNSQPSGLKISKISEVGNIMTFIFRENGNLIVPTPSLTPTPTVTPTRTPTPTPTSTPTPTLTPIPTQTPTPTNTPTSTVADTPTVNPTLTPSADPQVEFKVDTTFTLAKLLPNQMLTAKVSVANISSSRYAGTKSVLVLVALYDKNNTMVNISYISKDIPYQGTDILSAGFKLPPDVAGYQVQSFMWDGTDLKNTNMIPISNVVQIS